MEEDNNDEKENYRRVTVFNVVKDLKKEKEYSKVVHVTNLNEDPILS